MFEAEISSFPSFATVAVPIPIGPQGVLTYRIPEALRSRLLPGMRVLIPIGRRKTTGIVTSTRALSDLPDPEKAVRGQRSGVGERSPKKSEHSFDLGPDCC